VPASTSRGRRAGRAPHIRANELDLSREFFSDHGEEALERFNGSFAADPEQTRESLVDLVNQGQIFVAFGVLHFIHTDGGDRSERAMLQAQVTTYSTASQTFSQEVRNTSAVSFQESLRAQRARKSI